MGLRRRENRSKRADGAHYNTLDGVFINNATIQSVQGTLWITQEGEPSDYKVGEGEEFKVTQPGKVIIEGIPNARMRLVPAEQNISRLLTRMLVSDASV
jgi:hypothetical protein